MKEENADNSMDFVFGEEYEVFISYFLTNPGNVEPGTSQPWGAEVDGEKEPIFKKIYINKLNGFGKEELTPKVDPPAPRADEVASGEQKGTESQNSKVPPPPGIEGDDTVYTVKANAIRNLLSLGSAALSVFSLL